MTPEELDAVENRVADAIGSLAAIELRECGRALSKALRTAWAERDFAAKVADDAVAELTTRPSPEVVAKVREVLENLLDDDDHAFGTTSEDDVRDALRLLEAGGG